MRIFSGIRPSGALHLGNYLGAIKQWVDLQQNAEEMVVSVVDEHAVTTAFEPNQLSQHTLDTVRDYVAAGLDPDTISIIVQSWIPAHTEAAWLIAATSPLSWFEKVPTYKEKVVQEKTVSLGLLSYPALMAADILLYRSTHVPVGEDQLPHLELTNAIAKRLNHHYGTDLQTVEPLIPKQGARIMSLQNPTAKMSKSGGAGIALSDDPDTIRNKLRSAVTDSGDTVRYDPKEKPAVANLLEIGALLSDQTPEDLAEDYVDGGYVKFKDSIAEIVIDALAPIRERRARLDDGAILEIIRDGAEHARPIAQETLAHLKDKLGLLPNVS